MSETTPKGAIAIFTDEKGRVIATTTDFDRSSPGGWTIKEAQRRRASDRLATKVVREYSSPGLWRGINDYIAGVIVQNLVSDHMCRITVEYVGHDEGDQS